MSTRTYSKPLPVIDSLTRPFWDHARAGRLAVQACARCGDLHFPASPVCPKCLSSDQNWQVVSGRGEVLSWVVFHRAYWDSFQEDLPYTVCLVRLDEGPMLASNFATGTTAEPAVGARVEAVFEKATEEVTLPKFRLV